MAPELTCRIKRDYCQFACDKDRNLKSNQKYQIVAEYQPEEKHRAIREWREDERPRERLLSHGANTLSDAELLAILLGSGTLKCSAIELGRNLIEQSGDLTRLSARNVHELYSIKGMGEAKAARLAAAFELVRRVQATPFDSKQKIQSPDDIARHFIPRLRGAQKETFLIVMLDTANRIFRDVLISEGSLNASIVHPREVFRPAVAESAASLILLHNHPSGNPEPSREDIAITKQLFEAGKFIDISILDHLIIAGEAFTSLAQRGLMPSK